VKYELLIFDLDGTLIDTRQDIANSANIMLAHYGLEAKSVSEVTGYVGDGISAFVERCIGGAELPFDEAVAFFKRIYSEHLLENTTPYGGIIELLDQLEQYRKVVLTNKAYVPSKNIVDGLGLAPYFELLVGGDTLPRKKPFPDGIHHILEITGVAREKSLLVGDGKNDMLAASEARIRSVFVSWGFSDGTVAEDFSPDFRIDRPEELLKLL
jgi:phosphoglycolate phosphatase